MQGHEPHTRAPSSGAVYLAALLDGIQKGETRRAAVSPPDISRHVCFEGEHSHVLSAHEMDVTGPRAQWRDQHLYWACVTACLGYTTPLGDVGGDFDMDGV